MKIQKGYKLDVETVKWVAENYQKAGCHHPSHLVQHILSEAIRNDYRDLPDTNPKKVEASAKIGEIATRRRGRSFAIVHAVEDLYKVRRGLKKALEEGLITKKQYEAQMKENDLDHKDTAQLNLNPNYLPLREARKKMKELDRGHGHNP